jgi:hypothetical protein
MRTELTARLAVHRRRLDWDAGQLAAHQADRLRALLARGADIAAVASRGLDQAALAARRTDSLGRAGLPEPEVTVHIVDAIARNPDPGEVRRFIPLQTS